MFPVLQNVGGVAITGLANWWTSGTKEKLMSQLWCSSHEDVSHFFQELRKYGGTLSLDEKLRLLTACDFTRNDEWVAAMAQGLYDQGVSIFDPIVNGVSLFSQAERNYAQNQNDQLLRALLDVAIKEGSVIKYPDGSVFLGHLNEQGLRHGIGIVKLSAGDLFIGKFDNHELNGHGIWRNKDNTCFYIGEFRNAIFCGQGKQVSAGSEYVGLFEDNVRHGKGVWTSLVLGSQEKYDGEWVADRQEGQGVWTSPDGQIVYMGTFVKGSFDGEGVMANSTSRYEGAFKNGQKHGQGKLMSFISQQYSGQLMLGEKKVDMPIRKITVESVSQGIFENGTLHGEAIQTVHTEAGVEEYAGRFKNGLRDGPFLLTKGNDKFSVTYIHGERQGEPQPIVATAGCVPGCVVS